MKKRHSFDVRKSGASKAGSALYTTQYTLYNATSI